MKNVKAFARALVAGSIGRPRFVEIELGNLSMWIIREG
jgi:hypothetical protein